MILNDIVLYHYDEEREQYVPWRLRASIYGRVAVAAENGGNKNASKHFLRIPTLEAVDIATGDYIYFGTSEAESPERSACVRVCEYSDNRRGANPHWRVVCE